MGIAGFGMFIFVGIIYLVPIILVIYWASKMLKNSKEQIELNQEILTELKKLNQNTHN